MTIHYLYPCDCALYNECPYSYRRCSSCEPQAFLLDDEDDDEADDEE